MFVYLFVWIFRHETDLAFVGPTSVKSSDWFCEKCGIKNENIWLNLSDGSILCGRKYREGATFTVDDEIKVSVKVRLKVRVRVNVLLSKSLDVLWAWSRS